MHALMKRTCFKLAAIICLKAVSAGVCEELEIPMDTVVVPGMGSVCKVRECANPEMGADGKPICVKCQQGSYDENDHDYPGSEFCPVALGECQDGKCVPKDDPFYETNFGKKWEGLSTWHAVTITHYGGDMAAGGYPNYPDVISVGTCLKRLGIDGVAAVPSQMYGSESTHGQAIFKRNNLCYKLTGPYDAVRIVTIFDRCGGYAQCSKGSTAQTEYRGGGVNGIRFAEIDNYPGSDVWTDANGCVTNPGSKIYTGLAQRCWYFSDGSPFTPKACCPDQWSAWNDGTGETGQVDWCASNSHPHFDVAPELLDALCANGSGAGIAAGSCQLKWVEPIKCPLWPRPGVCCPKGETCGSCSMLKTGSCGDSAEACEHCDGTFCPGDDWYDICNSPDIPDPDPDWTPRPTDPPPHTGPVTPTAPPNGDDDKTTSPVTTGAVTTTTGGSDTTTGGGDTTTGSGGSTSSGADTTTTRGGGGGSTTPGQRNNNSGVIAGACAGAALVLAGAGLAAKKLAAPPTLEGEFEQDDAEGEDEAAREGMVEQSSQDFA